MDAGSKMPLSLLCCMTSAADGHGVMRLRESTKFLRRRRGTDEDPFIPEYLAGSKGRREI